MAKKKRILSAKIRFISLVGMGANDFVPMYASKDGRPTQVAWFRDDLFEDLLAEVDEQYLRKSAKRIRAKNPDLGRPTRLEPIRAIGQMNEERGELTAVVWAPEKEDVFGRWASSDTVRQMAHDSMRAGLTIDIDHSQVPLSRKHAWIAESFVIQPGDPRFAGLTDYQGNAFDPAGGWGVVIRMSNPELRRRFKSGEWRGISMGGWAEFEEESQGAQASGHVAASQEPQRKKARSVLRRLLAAAGITTEDDEMLPEQLKKELDDRFTAFRTEISSEIGKVVVESLQACGMKVKQKPKDPAAATLADVKEEILAEVRAALGASKKTRKADASKDSDQDDDDSTDDSTEDDDSDEHISPERKLAIEAAQEEREELLAEIEKRDRFIEKLRASSGAPSSRGVMDRKSGMKASREEQRKSRLAAIDEVAAAGNAYLRSRKASAGVVGSFNGKV